MGKYINPEYQEQLDGLAESICRPSEYEQSLRDFDYVFCPALVPGVPQEFFEPIVLEKTDEVNNHFQQRFGEVK